jgi:hypothetical protein
MEKKVLIYENFLNNNLLEECLIYSNSIENNFEDENVFEQNVSLWDKDVVEDSNKVYINKLNNESNLYSTFFSLFKKNFDIDIKCVNFYYWMQGSHIPWHDDVGHSGGITIYLNEHWNINHGGLFLFNPDDETINAIVPKKNRAIIQLGGIPHSVSATTKTSIIRKTIQIFF